MIFINLSIPGKNVIISANFIPINYKIDFAFFPMQEGMMRGKNRLMKRSVSFRLICWKKEEKQNL